MQYLSILIQCIFCHLIGDYVLQSNFIATTKGKNWYHMLIHCALYCFPFYWIFNLIWFMGVIFIHHFIIDLLKARYWKIGYMADQINHYILLAIIPIYVMSRFN